jgi:hypothetical protein
VEEADLLLLMACEGEGASCRKRSEGSDWKWLEVRKGSLQGEPARSPARESDSKSCSKVPGFYSSSRY